jgi:predicted phosphodiesterase
MPKSLDLLDILFEALADPQVDTSTPLIQAKAAALPKLSKAKTKNKKNNEWKLAVTLPDTQIGFRKYEDNTLDPFHDVHAINVAMQVLAALEEEHGVDKVINLGDTLDLPMFGKYATEPTFENTVNLSLKAGHDYIASQRAFAPNAEIVYIDGNHDCRPTRYMTAMARSMVGVQQVGTAEPIIGIPHLLNLKSIGNVTHVSGYPADKYYINPRLVARHGSAASSNGSTAMKHISNNHHESTIYGHSHRMELLYKTHDTSSGAIQNGAYSPGCLCRIDGAVPSYKGGTMLNLHPVKQYENWQQGIGVIWYKDTGEFTIENVHIMDGWGVYSGTEFRSTIK